jgi:hypothetical protein
MSPFIEEEKNQGLLRKKNLGFQLIKEKERIMIHCHLKIQFFTMWQGGPPLLFKFFLFFKNKLR